MKIIGFNASPRFTGNGKVISNKVLSMAREKGFDTEFIDLSTAHIKPCQSCNYCKTHAGICILDDDMQDIKRKITDCDAIILVAPIYFSQINAQATVFINRLYSFFQTEYVQKYENGYVVSVNDFNDFEIINSDKLKNIKISIILTQGEKDTTDTEKYIESGLFNQLNLLFDVKDVEILPYNNEPGIVKDKKDQIEVIEKVAKNLITQ